MVEAQNDAYSSAFIRQLCLIAGKSFFFSEYSVFKLVSYFSVSVFFIPKWVWRFLEEHLQPLSVYIQCVWQIFLFKAYCYFKGALAAIFLSDTVIFSGDHFQWDRLFSKVLCFFETSSCSHPFFQRYWVNSQFQLQPSIR